MINIEAVMVCRLIKAFCPAQTFDEFTTDAWTAVLLPLDYGDACLAIQEYFSAPIPAGQSRFMQPGHITAVIRDIRTRRLTSTPMPEPPAGLTSAEYSDWVRGTRQAIATGTYQPDQTPAIEPTADPDRIRRIVAEAKLDGAANSHTPAGQPTSAEPQHSADPDALEAERARQLAALERLAKETPDA